MRSQHPGISQPRPRQQQGPNDRQLWEQHLLYKQMQEIHRQQQLQQLDIGVRQQNSLNQQPDVPRQAGIGQSLPVLSGMPINETSCYMWSNKLAGGELKTASSSPMFLAGNMQRRGPPSHHGIANGLMFSHDQGQTMRSLGFVPQHVDQSLYGTPVSSIGYSLNHYPHSQGVSHTYSAVMNKVGGNSVEKGSMHPIAFNYFQNDLCVVPEEGHLQDDNSVNKQGFRAKYLFENAPAQVVHSQAMPVNFQQVNHFSRNVQAPEINGAQEGDNWSGKLQEDEMAPSEPSRIVDGQDRSEEKLLDTGNDGNWNGSFGEGTQTSTGGHLHGYHMQSNDHFSAVPSIQSGSWSALMLDALEVSSSDTGLQEEWSGLSYQKTELSTGNQSAVLSDNGKQQMTWDDSTNLQGASSLTFRPFPLFTDGDASPSCHTIPTCQQASAKFAYEKTERVDTSHESSEHSSKETNKKQFNKIHEHQAQKTFDDVSNGIWEGQMYGQSGTTTHSADLEPNLQKRQQVWNHQQEMDAHNTGGMLSDKSNGWNINESWKPSGDNISKNPEDDVTKWHPGRDARKSTQHMESHHDANALKVARNQVPISFPDSAGGFESTKSEVGSPKMCNAGSNFAAFMNKEINEQVPRQHHLHQGEHVASVNYSRDENVASYQNQHDRDPQAQAKDSTVYITTKETFDHKQENRHPRDISSEAYTSNRSHPSPCTDNEDGTREDAMFALKDSCPSVSSSHRSSSQSGRRTSGPRKFQYHPMGNSENGVESMDSTNHRLYTRGPYQSQFASRISESAVDTGKGHLANLQNAKGAEKMQSRGTIHSHDSAGPSFDGSTGHVPQDKSIGGTSHKMLELLHRVNQSRSGNTVSQINYSDHNAPSEITEGAASDRSASLKHNHSSALQDFGLKLAPPSQRQTALDHDFPSQASFQTANDFTSRTIDSGVRGKDTPMSLSTPLVPSVPLAHEVSQSENLENKTPIYGQTSRQASYSGVKGISSTVTASTLPRERNQFAIQHQQQQLPSFCSTGSAIHSARASLPSVANRNPPFRLNPSPDTSTSVASEFCSLKTGFSQPVNASSYLRSPGQELPIVKTKSFGQPSITSGMSQSGGFSSMLHNVWMNVPAQRRPVTQVQNISSNVPQSTIPLPGRIDTNSCPHQNADDQNNRRGSRASELGTCSLNSQEFIHGGEYRLKDNSSEGIPPRSSGDAPNMSGGASQVQESASKHPSDGSSDVSLSSLVRLHQQELHWGKHAHDSSPDSMKEHVPVPNMPSTNREIEAYGIGDARKSSVTQKQNYSLMQQVQAMKEAESDPSKRLGKRLRGADFGADALPMDQAAAQRFIYGQSNVFKELDATSRHSSFPSDVKMLSFSSRDKEEGADTISSEDLLASRQHDLQSHTHSMSKNSSSTIKTGSEQPQINSQIPPSWFGKYGNFKDSHIIPTYDGLGNSQRTAKATSQHYNFAKISENMDSNIKADQRDGATQVSSLRQGTPSTNVAANGNSFSHCMPLAVINNDMALKPKKRKSPTSELLPWHKEVVEGSQRLKNISMAELDWAQAVHRLIEKVEGGFDIIENVSSVSRPRRRLILTTQLMQQLVPSVPARFLTADATTSYESVTYSLAKVELGDACSLISRSGSDSLVRSDSGNRMFEKLKTSDKIGDHFLARTMDGFIGRSKKLEGDLLRLETRTSSTLDVRLECHELDRCSIMNRFAKFHGRIQTDTMETPSTSKAGACRIFPQRHITVVAASTNTPDGVLCLSL